MLKLNFTPFPELSTQRTYLKQVKQENVYEIFLLRSDELVNQYLDRKRSETLEDAQQFIEKISQGISRNELIYWGVIFKENNKLIGTAGLFNFSEEPAKAEIGYELLPAYQQRGLAKEVLSTVIDFGFSGINLDIIEAYTHPDNLASTALLVKNNFEKAETGEVDQYLLYKSKEKSKK